MKSLLKIAALSSALMASAGFAHHAAEGIVDADVWDMIDALVADTPHAELTLDDLGGGMTETIIEAPTVTQMERMMDDGLLSYLSMLDGDLDIQMAFNDDGSATLSAIQSPSDTE